ncbi:MAG: flagellar hook-length control protein FliK [Vicinamibacterales bacterium]
MAIAETGSTLVGPAPQAARATSTSTGSRHSGLGAPGSHSFAALMNGIADRDQAPDEVPPGDDARQQQSERRPQIDRGRAKPASSGRAASAQSSRPAEDTAEQVDTADTASGARSSRRSKAADAGSDGPVASKAAGDEGTSDRVVADPQTPRVDPRTGIEQTLAVEPLAAMGPGAQSAGLPPVAPAQADGLSSAGTIAAVGSDARGAGVVAADASTDSIIEAVGTTDSTGVEVSAASNLEIPLLDGASRTASVSVQGRHRDDRGIALSALRDALATTVQSPLTNGADAASTRIDSLSANASAGAHDVPSALAAYSLAGPSGVGAPLVSRDASQSTDDAPGREELDGLQTKLMPTGDQASLKITAEEIRSAPLRPWGGQTATIDRGAFTGVIAREPGVEVVPNGVEATAQSPNVVGQSDTGAVPSKGAATISTDGSASARRTLGAKGESSAVGGAVASSQALEAPADTARDANDPFSAALEAVGASEKKPQAGVASASEVPVRDALRVASPRRPQTATALESAAAVASTSKPSEQRAASQVAAVSATDTVGDTAAGPARQTRQSVGRSASDALDANQFDPLAEQSLGVASTTAASTASSRKSEVVIQATPKPTGTAAIAIAAFQAAAAAAPDLHRSASIGGTSVTSAALLDAQVRTPIVDAIRVQADNGNGQVRLRLNPEFLGDVTVDVRVNGGSVVASVHASSADVREWLRTNEAVLRQTLADQGLHLERLVVAEEDAQPGKQHPDQQREGASDQQREWERRSRRPRDTGTFEVVL